MNPSKSKPTAIAVPSRGLATFYVALSGLLYGTLCLFGIWLMQKHISVFAMLFWRFATAAVFTLAVGFRRFGPWREVCRKKTVSGLLLGAALYGVASSLLFFASERIGTGLSMVVFYSFPIFVFLWMWLVRKEQVSLASWASLAAVCTGFLFLHDDSGPSTFDSVGIIYGLIASAGYAFYILVSEKQADEINPWLSTFVLCVVSSIYFLVLALATGGLAWPQDMTAWLLAAALGVFSTALPVLLMLIGLQNVRADMASILSVFEPVGTLVLGVIFLHESLSLPQMVGIVIVLAGAMSTTISMSKKPSSEPEAIPTGERA